METCACCGYKTIGEKGNYEICHICYWEDDSVQEADPWFEGGANKPSLFQAQLSFKKFGAIEERFLGYVKKIKKNDIKNLEWRELREGDKLFVSTPKEIEEVWGASEAISYDYWLRSK